MLKTALCLFAMVTAVVHGRRVADLTHTLDKDTPRLDLKPFGVKNMTYYKRTIILEKYTDPETWLSLGVVEFYEHVGTHIDAPFHFGRVSQKLHEIPAHRLVGPGVVINVEKKAEENMDYAVTVEDLLEYEEKFGRIPDSAIVMMNSGWDRRYPDPVRMFGTTDINDFNAYHFPGFSPDACKFLFQKRNVGVVGVDTPAVDPLQLKDLFCHKYLQPHEVPLLEFVANLDSIPQNGTTIILGVPKIRNASGSPIRILAFVDEDGDVKDNSANHIAGLSSVLIGCIVLFKMLLD